MIKDELKLLLKSIKVLINKKPDKNNVVLVNEIQNLTEEEKLQARLNIGAGLSDFSGDYNGLINKPSSVLYTSQELTESEKRIARNNIGAGVGNSNFSGAYDDLTNIPSTVLYTEQFLSNTEKEIARTNIGAGNGNYEDLENKPFYEVFNEFHIYQNTAIPKSKSGSVFCVSIGSLNYTTSWEKIKSADYIRFNNNRYKYIIIMASIPYYSDEDLEVLLFGNPSLILKSKLDGFIKSISEEEKKKLIDTGESFCFCLARDSGTTLIVELFSIYDSGCTGDIYGVVIEDFKQIDSKFIDAYSKKESDNKYQPITDDNLSTDNKTITGAINEVSTALDTKANTVHEHTVSEISDFPTSLPASDVSDWAKASVKPTYTYTEVGADKSGSANEALVNAQTYTDTKIAELINSAPTTLDTLGEIASAMQENQNVVEALDEAIGTKANHTDLNNHVNNKENPHNVQLSQLGVTISADDINTLDGVTSNVQEQIDTKANHNDETLETEDKTLSGAINELLVKINELVEELNNVKNQASETALVVQSLGAFDEETGNLEIGGGI